MEDDGSWLRSGDLLHLGVGVSRVRDGGEELKATCLLFFWKKLVIVAWAVSWSSPLVDVLELGLEGLAGLRRPFLKLSIRGRGAVVPNPGMGRPGLMADVSSINSVSLSSSSSSSPSSSLPTCSSSWKSTSSNLRGNSRGVRGGESDGLRMWGGEPRNAALALCSVTGLGDGGRLGRLG